MEELKVEVKEAPVTKDVVTAEEKLPEEQVMTTMSWFLADITNAPVEVTPDLWQRMVDHAREALSVGCVPDWKDWRVLDDVQRRAWQEAAAELKVRDFLDRARTP